MKKDYITRLERWARWYLPRQEAEDVIADYREIAADPELLRGLGKPRDVIRPLARNKTYYTWLAAFIVMAACILLPAWSPLPLGPYPIWFHMFYTNIPGFDFCHLFLIAGLAVSLVWFRPRKGEPKPPLPRAVPIVLAVLLTAMGLAWWVLWQVTLCSEGALTNPIFRLSDGFWWQLGDTYIGGNLLTLLLEWSAVPLAVLGMVGLVKARTRDRRWRAVYFLSLSVMMLAFCVLSLLTSMVVSETDTWWSSTWQYSIAITIFGLVGTGVALC